MNRVTEYIPAGTTIEEFEREMESSVEVSFDFGMKIKGRNIFYILYLTDKLSKAWGFTFMIGDKIVINYIKKKKHE